MITIPYPGSPCSVTFHNHSNWSDGIAPLENMCRTAKKIGMTFLGMSDHWVLPPLPNMDSEVWSMKLARLDEYISTLQQLKNQLDDENFTIGIGLEVDFFFENIDKVRQTLSQFPLDFMVGSVHYSGTFPIDHDAKDWIGLSQDKIDEIWDIYWKKMLGLAQCGAFQILGHIDLPKKFAYKPSAPQLPRAIEVLDAVQKSGMAIELNTAGWSKQCQEAYPSLEILKAARSKEIPVVVSADAHDPAHLQRDFDKAKNLLIGRAHV